jgi:Zn-dependent protease with chaperone function
LSAIAAWQAASWSVVGGIVLAATMVAAPLLHAVGWVPAWLEACLGATDHMHGPADNQLVHTVAVLLLASVLFRLAGCGVRAWWVTHSIRARQRALLRLVGRHEPRLDARVVDDDTAAVYCLPGRGGCVVFTSGALGRLSGAQRCAVVAHERAHLRGRHDLLVASAALLRTAFPRVRLFDQAWRQTVALIEMRADDIAARRHGRRPLAEALVVLADMTSPQSALGAAGTTTTMRVERLLTPPAMKRPSTLCGLVHGTAISAATALLAASPVLLAAASHALLCPA